MLRPINNQILVEIPEDIYQEIRSAQGGTGAAAGSGDRSLIRKTSGGVLIPEAVDRKKNNEGRIFALGPGRVHPETGELIPMGFHFQPNYQRTVEELSPSETDEYFKLETNEARNKYLNKPIIKPLAVGDRILILRYSAYAVDYQGKHLLGCTEDEIIGVLDEDADDVSFLAEGSHA